MKKTEQAIQRELVKWIREEYPKIDIRCNKLDGLRNIIDVQNDKAMGQAIKGTPDLTLFYHLDATYIFELELKTKTGKLSASQKEWWNNFKPNMTRKGTVAHGLLNAQKKIKNWIISL